MQSKPSAKLDGLFPDKKSSHMILTKSDSIVILSVPLHDDLDRGTLRGLIGLAGLAVEGFVELL